MFLTTYDCKWYVVYYGVWYLKFIIKLGGGEMIETRGSHPLQLVACGSNPELWQRISGRLGHPLAEVLMGEFADGEQHIKIDESVRDAYVVVLQSTCPPVDSHMMQLLITIEALRRAGAYKIVPVMPYFGYARQDKKHESREPISAKLMATLLEAAGAHRIVAVDLHNDAIQGFFDIPVDHLLAGHILCSQIQSDGWAGSDCVVASTDAGGVLRAYQVAEALRLPMIIAAKHREKAGECDVLGMVGDPKGRRVIIIDDMVASAGSIVEATDYLISRGAEAVRVYATHGIFCDEAVETIMNSSIDLVTVTNTIPSCLETRMCDHIRYIAGMEKLLALAIERNYIGESLASLVKTGK